MSCTCSAGAGVGEVVGVGAGLDDGGVVGEAVDDRCAQAGVGEGVGPGGEVECLVFFGQWVK